jgi:TPR repeat protein
MYVFMCVFMYVFMCVFMCGFMYVFSAEALLLLHRAAEAEDGTACHLLGSLYSQGAGVIPSAEIAFLHYEQVCIHVCMHACMNGWMYGWMYVCM